MKKFIKYNISHAKDWTAILSSSIASKVIDLLRGFYVAKYLGPETFGILSAVQLISQLNKYGSLGFNSVVGREAPYYEGQGDHEKVKLVKDNAFSSDLVFALILFCFGMISLIFIENLGYRLAIGISSLGLLLAKVAKMYRTEITLEKKFVDIAKYEFLIIIIVTLGVLATVKQFGMYSVLSFTAFGSFLAIIVYQRLIDYRFKYSIDRIELLRQVKIGVPLVLSTLAYGSYRYSERLIVLTYLGSIELGYYALGTRIMDSILNIALTRIQVIKVHLSNLLGGKEYKKFHIKVVTETIITFFVLLLLYPVFSIIIDTIVTHYLDNYILAIPILKIIVLSSCVRVVGASVTIAIQSPVVNQQKLYAPLQFMATLFLILGASILHHFDSLNLLNFVLLDIGGFVIWHVSLVVVYYIYFVKKHVSIPLTD